MIAGGAGPVPWTWKLNTPLAWIWRSCRRNALRFEDDKASARHAAPQGPDAVPHRFATGVVFQEHVIVVEDICSAPLKNAQPVSTCDNERCKCDESPLVPAGRNMKNAIALSPLDVPPSHKKSRVVEERAPNSQVKSPPTIKNRKKLLL